MKFEIRMQKEIKDLVYRYIVYFESEFYEKKIDYVNNNEIMFFIIRSIHECFFNNVYQRLIDKRDEYINEKFSKIIQVTKYSPICLVNVIARKCLEIHLTIFIMYIDRKILNKKSQEHYMTCVGILLNNHLNNDLIKSVEKHLKHECFGPKIVEPLPNGQKMFDFKPNCLLKNDCAICHVEKKKACDECQPKYSICQDCMKKDWLINPQSCSFKKEQD